MILIDYFNNNLQPVRIELEIEQTINIVDVYNNNDNDKN